MYQTEILHFLKMRSRAGATLTEITGAIAAAHEVCGTQMSTVLIETPRIEADLAELVEAGQIAKETGNAPQPHYYLNG